MINFILLTCILPFTIHHHAWTAHLYATNKRGKTSILYIDIFYNSSWQKTTRALIEELSFSMKAILWTENCPVPVVDRDCRANSYVDTDINYTN